MRSLLLSLLTFALVMCAPLATDLAATALAPAAPTLSASLDAAGAAEAAFIRKGFVKKKGPNGNFRSTVIVADDPNHEVDTVDVALTPVGDAPPPTSGSFSLTLKNENASGNRQFDTSAVRFAGDAVGASYAVTSTMKDASGNVVGTPVTETVEIVGASNDGLLDSVTVSQVDPTNFQVQVKLSGDPAGTAVTAHVTFFEWEITEPQPEEIALLAPARQGHRSTFTDSTLTFGDPDSAVGQYMAGVVDLIDAEGTVVETSDFDLLVE